jgi:flagellar hook-associated protein 2
MSVAATASNSSSLALSGLASGLNWTSIINDMVTAESAPETTMEGQQSTLGTEKTDYQTIGTDLKTLNTDVTTLMAPNFFQTRTATTDDPSVASATAAAGTATGNYTFKISQLATEASWLGTTAAVNPISSSSNVAGVTVGSAGFATPITAGVFTVDGKAITIASTDTLASVFNQISTATGGAVTASYDPTKDEISLTSGSQIVLGSATDTSNFLQVAQLYNNGGETVTSAAALGSVNLNNAVSDSNLATTVTNGTSGTGEFMINGVAINFDASTDSINDILTRIDNSAAGVTATYDVADNQFQLTNNTTGNVGISLQDVSGNFLAATGLQAGKLQSGNNLQYSINGGGTLTSESNTIDSTSSGLTGLSVTAAGAGTTTVSVQTDTATIATAINQFVTDYNAAQTYISSQTESTTNSAGVATPGTLTGDMNVEGIASQLRELVGTAPSGLGGGIQTLNDIGITSDGQDNLLTVDSSALTSALSTNLSAVQDLFTNATNGLGTVVGNYLTTTTGTSGLIATQTANFKSEITGLATSISNLQTTISNNEANLQNQFVAMETAISTINSNKQYLTDFFAEPTASSAAPSSANTSSSSSTSGG